MEKKRGRRFIQRITEGRDIRKRISFVSDSDLHYENEGVCSSKSSKRSKRSKSESKEEAKGENTVTSSTLPSYKTIYREGSMRISSHKLYGEKAVLKGMNKRPRMKLRSGNTLMIKQINRVAKKLKIKNRERVGRQIETQYTRVVWDRRNRERRKKYKEYRRIEGKPGRKREDTKGLVEALDRYQVLRECEVYRNGYEVRIIIQSTKSGRILKKWQLEGKYRTNGRRQKGKTWRERKRREGLINTEKRSIEKRYEKVLEDLKKGFKRKYRERKKRVERKPERRKVGQIEELLYRSGKTIEKPIQQRRIEQPDFMGYKEKVKEFDQEYSGKVGGVKGFLAEDTRVKLQREVPTTQNFAKRKNVIRILERQSQKRDDSGVPSDEYIDVKKIRKLPEEERVKRYPHRSELDTWGDALMKRVEDGNRKKVIKGQEVDRSYAKYRELGRAVMFIYRMVRGERYQQVKQ